MRRAIHAALCALCALSASAITATKEYVDTRVRAITNSIAEVAADVATNAAEIATLSQSIDYSTNNAALVNTIETVAPQPGDYATVSNLAVHAVQTETDPTVPSWAKGTVKSMYNNSLYSWIYEDYFERSQPISTGWPMWVKNNQRPWITVGRSGTSDNSYPYTRVRANGVATYGDDMYHMATFEHDRIKIYPWWLDPEEDWDYVVFYFPTNTASGTLALDSDVSSATGALHRVATSGSYNDLGNTPDLGQYSTTGAVAQVARDLSAVSNVAASAVQTETDPTVPSWAKVTTPPYLTEHQSLAPATNYTDSVAARYLPLSGGVVTGSVFVAQQPGDTNAILAAVGEQTYGRFSVPASGDYPGLSIDYKDERTIAALMKEDDMPLVRLERIKHGRYSTYSSYTNQLRTIEYEKAELDMDGLGHVRIDKDGNSVACDIRWPEPPEGTNYVCGTMAFREEIPEVPTEWDYTAITNAPWLTSYTETDPTVPAWAKASSKPGYSYSEISGTPTTWPYTAITNAPWLTSYTETDPTVPGWAKASSKPSYSYSEISNTPDLSGYATTAALDAGTNTVAGLGARIFYGTCSTGASTAAKVVTCAGFKTTDLKAGTVLWVKFSTAQTYNGAPTINVNSTGAVNVKRVGTTNAARYEWVAGEMLCFVHDGSYWVLTDGGLATTSYYGATKLSTTATSTGTTLALTPASLNSFSQEMIAPYPVFSKTGIYEPGDRVRYSYNSYVCKASVVSQDWNAASWEMMAPIQTQLDDLRPSGPIATESVVRATSGDACRVSLASGATLSAALDVEGVPVMGIVEPAGAYSVSPSIHLLGYGTWPTNSFQAVFWRVGQTTYANVLSEL